MSNLEKAASVDETTLERLFGDEVTYLSPELREIIVEALRKARERRERKLSPSRLLGKLGEGG